MANHTFQLSTADKERLTKLLQKGTLSTKTFKRATALLELDRGRSRSDVAATLDVTNGSITNWLKGYGERGLEMLEDRPRPGRPSMIDGLQRARITALACSAPPEGYGRWSLRLLADKAVELDLVSEISHNHVGRILKKTTSNRT